MIPEARKEIDRQLLEQRGNADAIATRAGLMVAAATALLGLSAGTAGQATQVPPVAYWLIGTSLVIGVAIFWMTRLGIGPTPSVIAQVRDADLISTAKLILVEANMAVLTRVQVVFSLQVGLSIAGVLVLSFSLWPLQ